jgi:hypothetical protein
VEGEKETFFTALYRPAFHPHSFLIPQGIIMQSIPTTRSKLIYSQPTYLYQRMSFARLWYFIFNVEGVGHGPHKIISPTMDKDGREKLREKVPYHLFVIERGKPFGRSKSGIKASIW